MTTTISGDGGITRTGGVDTQGTNTNDSAAAGEIGEYVESVVASGSPISSTGSGQYFDVTSISLTAGDWDVSALVLFLASGATVTDTNGGIGTVSGNDGTGFVYGNTAGSTANPAANYVSVAIPPKRVSLSAATTYYLKAVMTYSVATAKACGRISARRVR